MTTITFNIRVRKGYVMVRVYIEIEHIKVKKSYINNLVKSRYSKLYIYNFIHNIIIIFLMKYYMINGLLGVFLVFETV